MNWRKVGEFGDVGSLAGEWECPDMFHLRLVNEQSIVKWVHIISINPGAPQGGSASQYFIGSFNGSEFKPDPDHDYAKNPRWIDFGFDFYAVITFENDPEFLDGFQYKTAIGWVSNWKYAKNIPTKPWKGVQSFPRELSLQSKRGKIKLFSQPAKKALKKLFIIDHYFNESISDSETNMNLKEKLTQGKFLFIKAKLQVEENKSIGFKLRKSKEEETVLNFDGNESTFTVDRRNSGMSNFSDEFSGFNKIQIERDKFLIIEILIDDCVLEVFLNEGEFAFTNLIFPQEESQIVEVFGLSEGNKLLEMEIHELKKTMGKKES